MGYHLVSVLLVQPPEAAQTTGGNMALSGSAGHPHQWPPGASQPMDSEVASGCSSDYRHLSAWPLVITQATDISTDPSCSRSMNADMALGKYISISVSISISIYIYMYTHTHCFLSLRYPITDFMSFLGSSSLAFWEIVTFLIPILLL